MKRSLQTFSAAFIIFCAVGLYEARQQRLQEDNQHFLLTLVGQYFDPFPDHPWFARNRHFTYRCKSQVLYEYDIDTDVLTSRLRPGLIVPPVRSSLSTVEIISVVTGLKVSEIIQMVKTGQGLSSREIIAGVLGALCGYNFGKWVGAYSRPSCDSPSILSKLETAEFRKGIGKELVERELNRYFVVEQGNEGPLTSRNNLVSIKKAAVVLPTANGDMVIIGGALRFFSFKASKEKVEYVCDKLLDLEDRIQRPDYHATLQDFDTAATSVNLPIWLMANRDFSKTAFPKLYRIVDYRDLESSSLRMIKEYLSFADSRFIKVAYIAMFIVGGMFLSIIVVLGVLTLNDWVIALLRKRPALSTQR